MYYTLKEPDLHKRTIIFRGLSMPAASQYCFVTWHKNEQAEAGDTLTHTFIKEPWPICQTRWFVFRGKIAGKWSKSVSAIFKWHHIAPPFGPPVTVKFYPTLGHAGIAADGWADRYDLSNYHLLRNGIGTSGMDTDPYDRVHLGSSTSLNIWRRLRRVLLHFDTTTLPAGSLLLSAKVILKGLTKNNTGGWPISLALVNSFDTTPGLITKQDYQSLGALLLADKIPYASFNAPGLNTLTIYPAYFGFITPGGVTQLALRDGTFDLPDLEPPWAYYRSAEMCSYSRDAGLAQSPCLEIRYQPPA